jgi:3-dehydroquinate synthase
MRSVVATTSQGEYEVLVGRGLVGSLGERLAGLVAPAHAVLVTDENVAPLYLEPARSALEGIGFEVSHLVLPAGEEQKTLDRAQEIYGVLYERRLQRGDVIVALGGGVIGDLAGFVAATFLRGVRLVQAPTTLLAQVDAAIGGKVGVDFRSGKNYIGTFYQPRLVVADLETLATLPEREVRNGWAEVVKYAFLVGDDLLAPVSATLDAGGPPGEEVVARCAAEKVAIVMRDEREETGERALLNLGHTIGHAIEAAGSFTGYSHGEAVGLGLRAVLWLSQRLSGLAEEEAALGQALLSAAGLPERLEGVDPADAAALTARDKKADRRGTRYVLLRGLGRPLAGCGVPIELEAEALQWLATR